MALKITKQINVFGEPASYECYTVITRIEGDKTFIQFEIEDRRFSNQEYVIQYLKYNFIPEVEDNSENFIKQGYEYLKTLEEYEDAADC
jgi:hypothetical protein